MHSLEEKFQRYGLSQNTSAVLEVGTNSRPFFVVQVG